jgi:hypothetical protein
MKTLYIRKEDRDFTRKVLMDMAFISSHKKLRLLKYLYEDGMYIPYYKDVKDRSEVDKYYLGRDKIKSEDNDFYFFDFPFKPLQVEDTAV